LASFLKGPYSQSCQTLIIVSALEAGYHPKSSYGLPVILWSAFLMLFPWALYIVWHSTYLNFFFH
jgi:hypothetical protein